MTGEQKRYFFLGYFYNEAQQYAKEFGYTQKEAETILAKAFIEDWGRER